MLTPTSSLSETLTFTTCYASSKYSVLSPLLFHSVNTALLVLRLFPGDETLTPPLIELTPVTLLCCFALWQCCPVAILKAAIPLHRQVSAWSTNCSWDAAWCAIRFARLHSSPRKWNDSRLQPTPPHLPPPLPSYPALKIVVVFFKLDHFFDLRKKQPRWKKMDVS